MGTNRYIGNPLRKCHFGGVINCADRAQITTTSPGEHTICDIKGNGLKLSDIKNGMLVKIRAKNVHWPGYAYLYTADGLFGKFFVIWNIKI